MTEPHWSWGDSVSRVPSEEDRVNELDRHLEEMTSFASRVEEAAYYLSVAFAEHNIRYTPVKRGRAKTKSSAFTAWLVQKCQDIELNVNNVSRALTWVPDPSVFRTHFGKRAFFVLVQDAPSRTHLTRLLEADTHRALQELAKHISGKGAMMTQAASLLVQDEEGRAAEAGFVDQYEAALEQALNDAGGALTLTQAAERMGISKAAVHKKVKKAQALGLMKGGRLLLPSSQFAEREDGLVAVVDGMDTVLPLFEAAKESPVATLQWLVARHPRLKSTPMAALHDGRATSVRSAARAYLQLDGA